MTRQIRLKRAEAMALGLLEPRLRPNPGKGLPVAPAIQTPVTAPTMTRPPAASGVPPLQDAPAGPSAGKAKSRRTSRKAKPHTPPAGHGSVEADIDGVARSVALRIDLVPVPKERARTVRTGESGKVMSYTPRRTAEFSAEVRRVAEMVFEGHAPFAGPVGVDMLFLMPIPRSWPRWKQEAARDGLIEPTARPDMDNLEKAFLDAVKGLIFADDALLTRWTVGKAYAETPGIVATYVARRKLGVHATRAEVEALRQSEDRESAS